MQASSPGVDSFDLARYGRARKRAARLGYVLSRQQAKVVDDPSLGYRLWQCPVPGPHYGPLDPDQHRLVLGAGPIGVTLEVVEELLVRIEVALNTSAR
jgi:hypothetical protein